MNAKSDTVKASDLKPKVESHELQKEVEELQDKNKALAENIESLKDQVARLNAQHVNQMRQLEKNSKAKEAFAISKFAKEVISIADVLETGLSHIEDKDSQHYRGMVMTLDQLNIVLKDHDVTKMSPIGQSFDSDQHEAITTQETDTMAAGCVLQVLQAGYVMKDRVLRHAKVIVSKEISQKG
jgi:molecular chaperone GrpE